MFKSKKIIAFVLLFSFFTLNIFTLSYAENYVVSLPELPSEPSGFEYYYIKKISDNEYNLYWINTTGVSIQNDNYYFNGKWWGWSYRVTEDINNHLWANRWGWYNGASDNTLIMPVNGTLDDCNIVYSNFDIKYNDTLLRSKLELNTEPIEVDDTPTLSGIGGFFNDLKSSLSSLLNNILTSITNGYNTLKNTFSNVGTTIVNAINNLFDVITSIPDLIISGIKNIIEFLFVPSENLFTYTQELFNEKFGIFNQVGDFVIDLTNIDINDTKPLFSIRYKGVEGQLIDFSMYEQYRSFIHSLIIAFSYFFFGKWLINNVPSILGGIYSSSD